jgi:enamine deaminase RidA (YjgF/YER057c/UK114 family)
MQIQRIDPGPRMSQGVVAGGIVYVAGQVADNTSADVTGQTAQVLAKIDAVLAKAGSSKSKLLSATIYLKDMADFAAMNQVWDAWVAADGKPARATVQAALATPDYRVEIQAVAAI